LSRLLNFLGSLSAGPDHTKDEGKQMRSIVRAAAATAAGFAVTFSAFAGASAPASAASSGCGADFASYLTVRAASSGAQAKAAQCLLKKGGAKVTVDGSFSTGDAKALAKFQRKVRLKADGATDRQTWTALLAQGRKSTLKPGRRAGSVARLQLSLRAAGFGALAASGSYGAETKTAVKKLQKFQGWKQTGITTVSVWRALQAGGAKQVKGPEVSKKKKSRKAISAAKGRKALAFAKRQLGDRYRYGASGPNAWDCSGLTSGAWRSAGVKLPHSAKAQFRRGKKVSRKNLRRGDLVFFYNGISHVAIYAGNGKVVHAARPGKPVEIIKMKYMPFKGARRVA
jgi:cell wall-associated NlpC family hydrolase